MLVKPSRGARHRQVIIHGHKHCTKCSRWRHVTDFTVERWADLGKTKPYSFRARCRTCTERMRQAKYYSRPLEDRTRTQRERREAHENPHLAEQRAVNRVLRSMTKENRLEYELEGIVPMGARSVADEDYDPTPVPQGCPNCFLHGGHACEGCPDPDIKERVREARKQRLIIGDPMAHWGLVAISLRA